jgi:hypothetical protein
VGKKSEEEEDEEESDKDATMEEGDATTKDIITDTEKGDEFKSKAANTIDPPKSTKSFCVLPVPSFHYLDRKRICNLQYEMVKSLQVQRTRERVIKAQSQYDAAYNQSIELQQIKSATMADLNKVVKESRAEEENVSKSRDMLYGPALHHWKKRQFQLQDMKVKYGKEQALYRDVSNDVLQDMKDRVCIRVSAELSGTGLGTYRLRTEKLKAESEDNIDREVSATVLGHMIDTVDRRYNDMLANYTEFVLPPQLTPDSIIVDHETGETLAQSYARKIDHLRAKITQLDSLFVEAEKKRCEKWTALNKAKGAGVAQSNSTASSSTVSKPKPRSRKSTSAIVPGGGGGAVVGSSRMSNPMQMQAQAQSGAPGYGNPSYYDTQRAAMASQQQLQARMMMQQQQQQAQAQQLAHMQNMLAQQQRQLQERAALGVTGLQFQSVPTNVVPQMRMAQYPQPHAIASTAVAPVSPSRSIPSEADSARNQPRAGGNVQPKQEQQPEGTSEEAPSQQRTTLLSKYGYGDRYSQSNVNARKKADGTVVPVSAPKLMPDGTFARPSGRQRKGMEWDAVKGIWYPLPEGQQPSNWSGDDEN